MRVKALVIGLGCLGLGYSGASYFIGRTLHTSLQNELPSLTASAQAQGLSLQVQNYTPGVFTSRLQLMVEGPTHAGAAVKEKLRFSIPVHIQHGPLLFQNGLGLGAATAKFSPVVSPADNTNQAPFALGTYWLSGDFKENLRLTGQLEGRSETLSDLALQIAPAKLQAQGNAVTGAFEGSFTWDGLQATPTANSSAQALSISPLSVQFNAARYEQAFYTGRFSAVLKALTGKTPKGENFTLNNLEFSAQSQVNAGALDSSGKLSIESFTGSINLEKLYYSAEFKRMNISALKDYETWIKSQPPASDPALAGQLALQGLVRILPQLLQGGMEWAFRAGAKYKNADYTGQVVAQFHPLPADKSFDTLTNPMDALSMVDITAEAKIPKSFDMAPLLAPMVGKRLTETEQDYLFNAKLINGKLTIGNETQDIQPLLMAVLKGMAGKAAAP